MVYHVLFFATGGPLPEYWCQLPSFFFVVTKGYCQDEFKDIQHYRS
jgi:hypothetical protein